VLDLLIAALVGTLLAVIAIATVRARATGRREARAAAMEAVARRYALGDLSRPSPDYGDDDLGRVARSMDAAVQELGQRVNDLTRDRARMQAILASMVEGVLVVDGQGRLQMVNGAARRLLKLDREATGRPYLEVLRHPGIADQIGRTLGGHAAESLELNLALDRSRTLVARVAPVVAEGRGAVLVLHDVTDLKTADQIRRDFVANVSHELRTPLTAIKGYAEALIDDPDDEDARHRFLDIIHRHVTRMERLVKDLLRLARLDAGQEAVELAPCDVQAIATGVVADLEPVVQDKRQHVAITIPPDARILVSDPAKLHDILRNLIENAVNYTPEEGTIALTTRVFDGQFEIAVSDTGPGLPEQDLLRVFERFYRVDKARARPGTGLGLAIVKHLVQVMGGTVVAGNRAESGAVFTVQLPLRNEREKGEERALPQGMPRDANT
jgi:two-component system, OmpR family, phosphate regulon sensor histidine kinase PhoR